METNAYSVFPNCSAKSATWRCLEEDRTRFEDFFHSLTVAQLTVYSILYVMCFINTIVCLKQFSQDEFRGRSIPTMLKMKSASNLACMTCWLPVRILFQTGDTTVTISKAFVCPLVLFFAHLFAFMSNWTEAISALYRFVRGIFPVVTMDIFMSEKPAFIALAVAVLLSTGVNANDLILPAVYGCQRKGRLYCTPKPLPANAAAYFALGYWVPVVICLSVLVLMTALRRKRLRESQKFADPVFQRSYSFGYGASLTFIVTSVPWIAFCSYLDSTWDGLTCGLLKRDLTLWEVTFVLRHLGLSVDWLAFLAVSPLFRYETAFYLRSQLRRSQVLSA